jgi:hypothetical protein
MTVGMRGRNVHLYKMFKASEDALAHTSGVVDDAPPAF